MYTYGSSAVAFYCSGRITRATSHLTSDTSPSLYLLPSLISFHPLPHLASPITLSLSFLVAHTDT